MTTELTPAVQDAGITWHPVETAPKDGEPFYTWMPSDDAPWRTIDVAKWLPDCEQFGKDSCGWQYVTHWTRDHLGPPDTP